MALALNDIDSKEVVAEEEEEVEVDVEASVGAVVLSKAEVEDVEPISVVSLVDKALAVEVVLETEAGVLILSLVDILSGGILVTL